MTSLKVENVEEVGVFLHTLHKKEAVVLFGQPLLQLMGRNSLFFMAFQLINDSF